MKRNDRDDADGSRKQMKAAKIGCVVLGATGSVGQRFIQLLEQHPQFEIVGVGASEKSANKPFGNVVQWKLPTPCPPAIARLVVKECTPEHFAGLGGRVCFSALDSSVAGTVEDLFADAGWCVFSNARNHRMDDDVPILVPFVNADHIHIIKHQREHRRRRGYIVTNANCSSTGFVIALKPLVEAFHIERASVFTMQAISGAGYPGVASMDILDNVIPYISGEEAKLETEPLKMLGGLSHGNTAFACLAMNITAHCNRVTVFDGHTACTTLKLSQKSPSSLAPTVANVEKTLREFRSQTQPFGLHSEPPEGPLFVFDGSTVDRPQPRLDRDKGGGFTVCVGRIREDPVDTVKFVFLSHNTIIGAAGGSVLNAELALHHGYI